MRDLARALREKIAGEVRFDRASRLLYSTDASIYEIQPVGVVIPRTPDDVFEAVESAREFGVPLLPRGAGTSLAGQTVGEALVIDTSKYLNRILEINTEERWARVEPGVVQAQLNRSLAPHGFLFGPDTATANRATLGGMIGNNSAGAHSILYGKTVDHVIEIESILASGALERFGPIGRSEARRRGGLTGRIADIVRENESEIEARFPRLMRRVSGYNLDALTGDLDFNLAKLIAGSEGTLALIHGAKVRIEPRPRTTGLMVVHFADILDAIRATDHILPIRPAAIELLDDTILNLARGSLALSREIGFVEGDPGAVQIVEFYGENRAEVESRLDELEMTLRRERLGYAYPRARTPRDQASVWNVRKAGLGLLLGMKGDRKPIAFIEDCAVDPEHLPAFFDRFRSLISQHDTSAGYYGHASVGCLHIRPLINTKLGSEIQKMKDLTHAVADLVLEFGGAMSGEHGDGLARSHLNEKLFGRRIYKAFRDVKGAFDPENRMNPGKIVDAPAMDLNLRYGEQYKTQSLATRYDFTREGGLAAAVELCNGAGVCRKLDEATMCPSYMATREELHSTRGRANLMRAVLAGDPSSSELADSMLDEALDLCLECKACKAECPSNVDMAKLKYEFLARSTASGLPPLRSFLFARIHRLSQAASFWPRAANWVAGSETLRSLLDRWVGIDRRRALPPIAEETFEAWFRDREVRRGLLPDRPSGLHLKRVVLFHDTFMNFNYPEIGKAATELLERAGYHVVLADRVCCGRPMISKGFAEAARAHAADNVRTMGQWVRAGYAIVGCEPSCILTFRDEYRDLVDPQEQPDVENVANATFLLEEFIQRESAAGRWSLDSSTGRRRLLLHTHCHEKALVGSSPLKRVLETAYEVEEVDAGCCGMAGAFGYEKEHYGVSMKIGSQRLFPAIDADPAAIVVTAGVSCRQQIQDATGREALHPAQALLRALMSKESVDAASLH